jgi:parallel beta-helix repeat protein
VKRLLLSACALILIALGLAANAFAKELRVGACANGGYATIQAAVNAASAGDKVKVCPGTYTEQVTVGAGKDGLSLESEKPLQAVIKAPALMTSPKAIVYVNGAQNVGVRGFTISGPGSGNCDSLEYGVLVDNGSASVEKNHIASIRDVDPASPDIGTGHSGCQNGGGVRFGRQIGPNTTGSGTIKDNVIDDYQKGGIVVDNVGSSATVEHNTVVGWGPSKAIAQNGIQISRGATASVKNNSVSGNVYQPATVVSVGVLLFTSGAVNVENNDLDQNDVGVYATPAGAGTTVKNNKVSNTTYDGIAIQDSDQVAVSNNNVTGGEPGIGVYGTTNSVFENNQVTNSRSQGIFADSASSGNTFKNDKASGTVAGIYGGPFDCEDDSTGGGTAGTANFWLNDKGATSQPAGICKP